MMVGLFCHVSSERIGGNGLKLCQERLRFYIRRSCFSVRVLRYWNELPREDVESSSLEVLRSHLG